MSNLPGGTGLLTGKGEFPMSRNFYVRTYVKFSCVNKTEAMYERPRVNVKVDS